MKKEPLWKCGIDTFIIEYLELFSRKIHLTFACTFYARPCYAGRGVQHENMAEIPED